MEKEYNPSSGPSPERVKAGLKKYDALERNKCADDRAYCRSIDKLIPLAMAEADKKAPGKIRNLADQDIDAKKERSMAWSALYHQEMNQLAREAGLRSI